MNVRKVIAPAAAVLLLVAIGVGIWASNRGVSADQTAQQQAQAQADTKISVRGMIGSEKESFFNDERVKKALLAKGITVAVEKVGSRAIADRYDPKVYDFGFPSGSSAGLRLKQKAKAAAVYSPFYTPMVFASWKPIADILVANGIAKVDAGAYYIVDLPKLMKAISEGQRWRDLKESQAFATSKAVMANTTDVRTSNSAGMFLGLVSYVANGQQVVQSQADVDKVMDQVAPIFLKQGFQEQSSSGPFEDYLALGMGKAPLLVIYESQMVEFWLKNPDKAKSNMVLMYPQPTVYSKHVFVPFNANGDRLGQALESDPELRKLAQEYGYRTAGASKGPEAWKARGVNVPDELIDVIDPPSQEWQETMIKRIEALAK